MTAPRFRCTADEPPSRRGGMFGPEHRLDSDEGLVLDEFVLEDVVHLEHMDDSHYHLRVGGYTFAMVRKRGHWVTLVQETP